MAERRVINGYIYERGPDGKGHLVGPAPGGGPVIPPNPIKVAEAQTNIAQGQASAGKSQAETAKVTAQLPYVPRQSAADAAKAEADAIRARNEAMVTPGQKALDEAFAKDYADWTAGGGYTQVGRQLDTLRQQVGHLQNNDNITGPLVGRMPDFINSIVNPQAIDVRQNVEQAIQGALRPTLGAQFTQQEGERMISRGFNPTLQEGFNVPRLKAAIDELQGRAQAKNSAAQYFEQHGTLKGWKGNPSTFQSKPQIRPELTRDDADKALAGGYRSLVAQMQGKAPAIRQAMLRTFESNPDILALKTKLAAPAGRGNSNIVSVERVSD